jgi:hypothetical protein
MLTEADISRRNALPRLRTGGWDEEPRSMMTTMPIALPILPGGERPLQQNHKKAMMIGVIEDLSHERFLREVRVLFLSSGREARSDGRIDPVV